MNHANRLKPHLELCRLAVALAALSLLPGVGGCQLFGKTFLDPSQPIFDDPESVRLGIKESIGLYDQAAMGLPKEATDPAPQDLQVLHEDYRLARGDTVGVQVWELQAANIESSFQRRISDSGYISLLKIPSPIFLAGQTEQQAQHRIAQAYRDVGVLDDPQVSVAALTRGDRTFYVLGPFNQPGAFNIPSPDFRMINALGLVGGLISQSAEYIHVIRTEAPEEAAPPGVTPGLPGAAPGASPLGLPGGRAPVNGTGTAPPLPPDGGSGLESWTPERLGVPAPPTSEPQPPTPTDVGPDLPTAPHPLTGLDGRFELRDGRWVWVAQASSTAPDEQARFVVPATRVIRIHLPSLRNGDPRYNIVVRNKDVLVAPTSAIGEYYLMGFVNRPGVYNLLPDRKLTLTQAIAAGGGFHTLAIPSRVQLIRRIGAENQMVFVDVAQIIEGRADDYLVKPGDVINVGTSFYAPFLAVIRNAFRATYGVGFVYDRNYADVDSYSPRSNPHD